MPQCPASLPHDEHCHYPAPLMPLDQRTPVVARRKRARSPHQSLVVAEGVMESAVLLEVAGGTAAVFSTRSPHKIDARMRMWPPFCRSAADHGVLAVADGLGGHAGGERASRLAVETDSENHSRRPWSWRTIRTRSTRCGRRFWTASRRPTSRFAAWHRGGDDARAGRDSRSGRAAVPCRRFGDSARWPARQAEVSDDRPFADRLRGRGGADRREGCDPSRPSGT